MSFARLCPLFLSMNKSSCFKEMTSSRSYKVGFPKVCQSNWQDSYFHDYPWWQSCQIFQSYWYIFRKGVKSSCFCVYSHQCCLSSFTDNYLCCYRLAIKLCLFFMIVRINKSRKRSTITHVPRFWFGAGWEADLGSDFSQWEDWELYGLSWDVKIQFKVYF